MKTAVGGAHHVLDWALPGVMSSDLMKEWSRFLPRTAIHGATVVVAPSHDLDDFDREDLSGKTIVTSTVGEERLAKLRDKGVAMVVDGSPFLFDHVIAPSLLDAMIIAATGKRPGELLEDDDLEILTRLEVEPRILYPNGFKRVNRFAFVIHPLSQEYFKKVKPIELLSQVSPPVFMDTLEKAMVVGATGAIGSVCARLPAMAADEVYMVSPETVKLLSFKESILGDPRRPAVPLVARRQGLRRHGRDRHRDLGGRQEDPRHHEGQARMRDHRRRPPARPAAERGGLGLRHGMQLAAISGVNGPYSDADIDRVRELALAARAQATRARRRPALRKRP